MWNSVVTQLPHSRIVFNEQGSLLAIFTNHIKEQFGTILEQDFSQQCCKYKYSI